MKINQDQIDSLIRGIVKGVGPLLVAHGLTALSTTLNTDSTIECIGGAVMTVLAFYASHKSNAPAPTTAPPAPATPAPVAANHGA
jgi:predicted lipid-binding transport protein (Tim44 family)